MNTNITDCLNVTAHAPSGIIAGEIVNSLCDALGITHLDAEAIAVYLVGIGWAEFTDYGGQRFLCLRDQGKKEIALRLNRAPWRERVIDPAAVILISFAASVIVSCITTVIFRWLL